jgi:hypothetical protein
VTSTRSAIQIPELEEKSVKKSLAIATASVYAAMYVALALAFQPFGYGQINLRVANILVGLVPLIGWPGIVGQTVGVLVANSPGLDPLGPLDLLNVIPTFALTWVIWKLRKKSVFLGLTLYSIGLGLTVSLVLNKVVNLPLSAGIPYVTVGIFLATTVLGYFLYRSIVKLGLLQRLFPEEIAGQKMSIERS